MRATLGVHVEEQSVSANPSPSDQGDEITLSALLSAHAEELPAPLSFTLTSIAPRTDEDEEEDKEEDPNKEVRASSSSPVQWFGATSTTALRSAQSAFAQATEHAAQLAHEHTRLTLLLDRLKELKDAKRKDL